MLIGVNLIYFLQKGVIFFLQKIKRKKFLEERYKKFFLTGLGCKFFIRRKNLYFLLGFSHYIIIKIPMCIKVIVKKKMHFVF